MKTHHLGTILAALVVTMTLLAIYFNFIDGRVFNKAIIFTSDILSIETDKTEYKAGDEVQGHFMFCKKRNITGIVQWTLVDHILSFFPPKSSTVTVGCHDLWAPIAVIPKSIEKHDKMYFEGYIRYQVNPFSTVTVPLKTKSFSII